MSTSAATAECAIAHQVRRPDRLNKLSAAAVLHGNRSIETNSLERSKWYITEKKYDRWGVAIAGCAAASQLTSESHTVGHRSMTAVAGTTAGCDRINAR